MYIHYGHKKFLKNKFNEIQNQDWIKPFGGLWASDENAEYGWKQWCEQENFRECNEDNCFRFELKKDTKVLHIRSVEDAKQIITRTTDEYVSKCIDFEKLKAYGIDAIELHLSDDFGLYWQLYGWDCDSILILNKDVVKEVTV